MKFSLRVPDLWAGGELRLLEIDTDGPRFSGDHSMVVDLFALVVDGRAPLEPAGWSEPTDWSGLSGVKAALLVVDNRFGESGSLRRYLPDELRSAQPKAILIPDDEILPDDER